MNTKNKNQSDLFERETSALQFVAVLGLISVLSGVLISLGASSFSNIIQWNIIGHSFVSALLFFYIVPYIYYHFKRSVGIRKPGVLFTGLLSALLILSVFVSGFWLVIKGHQESMSAIPKTHFLGAYGLIFITAFHLLLHCINRRNNKKKKETVFITASKRTLFRMCVLGLLPYTILLVVVSVLYSFFYVSPVQKTPSDYQTVYGPHPFRPSLTETDDQILIHVDQIAKSQQCAACHQDIYDDWTSSAHKQAASDPTYVKNITLLVEKKGIVAARYCEGCHAPVALLTGELTEGGTHGGISNTRANFEGVGCMGCHGIEKAVSTLGTASYHFSAKEHYLFDSSSSKLGQKVRNFLIQSSPEKHKQAMSGEILKDPKLCATCHEQFMDKDINDWGWVKMQNTYQSWLKGPFSGQNNQLHSESSIMRCQDCHFAKGLADDPSADSYGQVASHRSLGANTMLPVLNGDKEQLEETKRFLQSAKVVVHIEKPAPESNVISKQFVQQDLRFSIKDDTPYFLYLGDTAKLSVTVANRFVGHSFPSGTNDLNQAWLYFRVTDASDNEVYVSGSLDKDNFLDKSAHVYHAIPVDRFGKKVWRHDLFRMTGEVYSNVIEAGQSDIKDYQFKVPSWAKSPLTVEVVLKYRKLNQQYAQWALNDVDINLPIVDMARDSLLIPINKRINADPVNK